MPFAVALLLVALQTGPVSQATGENLAAAKTAYASAAYEDALALLSTADSRDDAAEVQEYRALCLLALARVPEAQQAIAQLIRLKPRYRLNDAETPPRMAALFHQERRRVLPELAMELYVKARTTYDEKKFAVAYTEFKDVLVLLWDSDVPADQPGIADLRKLVDGFLRLTEAEVTPANNAHSATDSSLISALGIPAAVKMVFTEEDKDVRPPIELVRSMPEWKPPTDAAARAEYHGVLELLIDEKGAVASATIREPISKFYDALLVQAAKQWRYRPAMRNGQPVKYRKLIAITLKPTS